MSSRVISQQKQTIGYGQGYDNWHFVATEVHWLPLHLCTIVLPSYPNLLIVYPPTFTIVHTL